jgi:hypothetical protein
MDLERQKTVDTALHLVIEDALQPLRSFADLLDGVTCNLESLKQVSPESVMPAIADVNRHLLDGAIKKIGMAIDGVIEHLGTVEILGEMHRFDGVTVPFEKILDVKVNDNAKNVP